MEPAQTVTLTISIIALVLALFALYTAFFHKHER